MNLVAITSGTAATLTWLAFVGIVVAAVILHWPRQFSGPLTEYERGLTRRRFAWRSFALVLVTPLSAIFGFALLLPPLVYLEVSGGPGVESCELPSSVLSALSTTESTAPWVDAVRCRTRPGDRNDVFAQAIVEAAADGFRVSCRPRAPLPEDLSIELSLVELAARAYFLTGVSLDPGPRTTDPDPWDIMERTLRARRIETCSRRASGTAEEGTILRLGPTSVTATNEAVEVAAVVRGTVCNPPAAELLSAKRDILRTCEVQAPKDCAGKGQRVVSMHVSCGDWTAASLLRVGAVESRVSFDRTVKLRFAGPEVEGIFTSARSSPSFVHDLRRRGLEFPQTCDDCTEASIVEIEGDDVIVYRPGATRSDAPESIITPPELGHGPFSWSGVANSPRIRCSDDRVTIEGVESLVGASPELRDPTATYALMGTIVWAAKAMATSSCTGIRRSVEVDGGAHPLLTAAELEDAVAAMRRGRETLGLLCLGLSLVALALSWRRSVR
ncbi:hypothetical protein [Nannocystis sp.]|uniref:hypothetical protein n=1 Tax=Nannocystis sp. TaxID=1962667 RepID=UPI0025DADC75|nr:hypothetical protein [Nannocystis sp.]MBK7825024.1 hypothetical protein [Nannocystis sp.]